MRASISTESTTESTSSPAAAGKQNYDEIEDIPRLERLVKAREKSRANLESRVAWAGLDAGKDAVKES